MFRSLKYLTPIAFTLKKIVRCEFDSDDFIEFIDTEKIYLSLHKKTTCILGNTNTFIVGKINYGSRKSVELQEYKKFYENLKKCNIAYIYPPEETYCEKFGNKIMFINAITKNNEKIHLTLTGNDEYKEVEKTFHLLNYLAYNCG